jgi:hypothetical protein
MTAVPDYIGAMFTHARSDTGAGGIVSLAGTRISGDMGKWQGMPTYGVLFIPVGGTDHFDVGHILPRVDAWCYGPGRREAMELWRTVYGWFMRYDGGPRHFKYSGCLVQQVILEGGPNYIPEPDTGYPRVVGTFILRVAAVLVA